MSFIKIYKEDWSKILYLQTYPTKGSFYVGYDDSGNLGYTDDILLQMDEDGFVTPVCSCSGGTGIYINPNPVPETIGGIEAGTTFPSGKTMQEMWDMLLYPYQTPSFSSFYISGQATTVELGYDIPTGNHTFIWHTTNSTNVEVNSVWISSSTGEFITKTGLANDGSEVIPFISEVTRNSSDGVGSRTWNIGATNTNSGTFGRSYSVSWQWRWYWGTSTSTSLNEPQIESLTSSGLYSSYSRTYSFGTGGYKYLCFANNYGGPSSFVDELTMLNVAMYGGYSNSENGFSYDLVTVTNIYGETTNYRVYRTQNVLGGAINIIVS